MEGILAMKQSWPSMMRTLFGDHKRYEETYFSAYKVRLLSSTALHSYMAVFCCFFVISSTALKQLIRITTILTEYGCLCCTACLFSGL